ncbi:hypothetical protein ACVWZK_000589 [Bradyrhizobium sp. GM0.4]
MAEPLDDYIDAVTKALALPVEEAWRASIRANLEVSLRLGRLVDEFALPERDRAGARVHGLTPP